MGFSSLNSYRPTIFARLVVVSLIIFLPVYAIGFGIYNWGSQAVRDQISRSLSDQVSFYAFHLQSEIERIRLLQYQMVDNADLNELADLGDRMPLYDRLQSVQALQDALYVARNSSQYIQNVSAHLPRLGITVSAVGGMMDLQADKLGNLRQANSSSQSRILFYQGQMYLYAEFPIVARADEVFPKMAIEIQLSEQAVTDVLRQLNVSGIGDTVLVNKESGIFLSSGDDPLGPEAADVLQAAHAGEDRGAVSAKLDDRSYLLLFSRSEPIGMTLIRYMPEDEIYETLRTYRLLFWMFTIASGIIFLLFAASSYDFIHRPLSRLVRAFRTVEHGDLSVRINHYRKDEFDYLYRRFNEMVQSINNLIDQMYNQKILRQDAELKQLQAQINPHFLYNTYFVLYSMAKAEDYDNVLHFLKQLGGYFQYITRSSASEIPLVREVEHARTYAEIQAMRFSNRVSIDFPEVPDDWKQEKVPRLIVQPIIENAFEHVLEGKLSQGTLKVGFEDQGNRLLISIEDNGEGIEPERLRDLTAGFHDDRYEGETTGLINIHRRLRLMFGEGAGIELGAGETGGLRVTLFIVHKEASEHV